MSSQESTVYEFGPFRLESTERRLLRDGEVVPLQNKVFDILLLLAQNKGRLVTKAEFMNRVWSDSIVEDNNLTVGMTALRKALGVTPEGQQYIETVPRVGYRFAMPVVEVAFDHRNVSEEGPLETKTGDADKEIGDDLSSPEMGRNGEAGSGAHEKAAAASPSHTQLPADAALERKRSPKLVALACALLLTLLLAVSAIYWLRYQYKASLAFQKITMSRLTSHGRVHTAAISPDGQYLAYVRRDDRQYSIWLNRIGTASTIQIVGPSESRYKELSFSHDGSYVAYLKCEGGSCTLYAVAVLGGAERKLIADVGSPISFAPDGKRIAFARINWTEGTFALIIANSDGTGELPLIYRKFSGWFNFGGPAWSPDGKVIAYAIGGVEDKKYLMRIVCVGVEDGKETTFTSQVWRLIMDMGWLSDGSGLIVNGRDQSSPIDSAIPIWHISYPQGATRRITNDLRKYYRMSMAAGSNSLVAVEDEISSNLWIASSGESGRAEQITHSTIGGAEGDLGLSWVPDGRIVYVRDESGKRNLWIINADGSGQKQLTDEPHPSFFPSVSPDGRYIIFESGRDRSGHCLWRINIDGHDPIRLTEGSYDAEAQCSPDGKWVVYTADFGEKSKVYKVPIDGGQPVPLTEDFASHPAISPDGKQIAYYHFDPKSGAPPTIAIVPLDGGEPLRRFAAPDNFGPVLRWAYPGDALSYLDNRLVGIWEVPLEGGAPKQLAQAKNGEGMFYFNWQQGSRNLTYALGTRTSDVILIRDAR